MENNLIKKIFGYGIYMVEGGNNVIANNIIRNILWGIHFYSTNYTTITGNLITGTTSSLAVNNSGIILYNSGYNNINNNGIYDFHNGGATDGHGILINPNNFPRG